MPNLHQCYSELVSIHKTYIELSESVNNTIDDSNKEISGSALADSLFMLRKIEDTFHDISKTYQALLRKFEYLVGKEILELLKNGDLSSLVLEGKMATVELKTKSNPILPTVGSPEREQLLRQLMSVPDLTIKYGLLTFSWPNIRDYVDSLPNCDAAKCPEYNKIDPRMFGVKTGCVCESLTVRSKKGVKQQAEG